MHERIITVTGRGAIRVVPDVTRIELSLVSVHDTYQEAYGQTKADIDRLSGIMASAGLDKSLPKTTRLDIDKKTVAEYDKYNHYKGDKFLGFQLVHQVRIDLGMDNVLLNGIIKAIGKELRQAEINIGYTVKDPRPAQLKMLERAVKDAHQKAGIMATAAGCSLGECKSISYSVQELHVYAQTRSIHGPEEACCCNRESLDITPEDLEASDTVEVVWALANA